MSTLSPTTILESAAWPTPVRSPPRRVVGHADAPGRETHRSAGAGTVIYRLARTRRDARVGVAGHGEEAGHVAPADLDDARTGRWAGVGDFDDLVRQYRRELHVYCYRMLGSFDDAEDHVQEVLLRAWRSRDRQARRNTSCTWSSASSKDPSIR